MVLKHVNPRGPSSCSPEPMTWNSESTHRRLLSHDDDTASHLHVLHTAHTLETIATVKTRPVSPTLPFCPPSWSHALQLFRGSKRGNLPAISDSYIAINLFPVWFDNCDTRTLMVYCASCFFSREKIVLIDLLWVGTPTLSGSSVNYSICKKNDEFCPKIKHTGEEERPRSGTLCDSARCRN
jgi:hypothetical protein